MFRGLDVLAIKWATGDLPEECRFLLNTQLMLLKKEKDPTSKQFDDDECIRSLTEAQEITTDVPKGCVMYDQQEVVTKKVRPIQMEEFLRTYVSRRLFGAQRRRNRSPHDSDAAALSWIPRRRRGLSSVPLRRMGRRLASLTGPIARINVDEKHCFRIVEWRAVREAASWFLPKHTAAAAWKHRNLSHVDQERLAPMSKDRGAEQGDVDRPLESSLALGVVAAEARGRVAAHQASGSPQPCGP